jgi:hypothetical protein
MNDQQQQQEESGTYYVSVNEPNEFRDNQITTTNKDRPKPWRSTLNDLRIEFPGVNGNGAK